MKKIKTKEDVFKLLDTKLDESERREFANADDVFDYHFTLGLWIRNNLIHKGSVDLYRLFCDDGESNDDVSFVPFMPADMISSIVMQEYHKYLQGKFNQKL